MGYVEIALVLVLTAYVGYLWTKDYRLNQAGEKGFFPGAYPCGWWPILWGAVGTLVLLGLECWGESLLGLVQEQSTIGVLFLIPMLCAAFGEELVFRGYLISLNKGRGLLVLSIIGFSLLFALLHPFFWDYEEGALSFDFGLKAWFSTGAIFVNSLWFYCLRIFPGNPQCSLVPCFVAHGVHNVGVFAVKAVLGFTVGWV